jgi:hypothetical protein
MSISHLAAGTCVLAFLFQPALAAAQDREGRTYEKVSFYFAAHEDDWQLFMNPSAFLDVADAKTKAVFVHLTAGDAGLGTGTGGRKFPYYLARENGAETAIRFMADAGNSPLAKNESTVRFNGHSIYRVADRNTMAYFLRLPDGNLTGAGFSTTGNQSLSRFAAGQISTLPAIDGSTSYRGWADLVSTLRALLNFERGSAGSVRINVAEPDAHINPDDHPDHLMTSKAALDAAKDLTCANRAYYVEYASSGLPENLDPQGRDLEISVLAVTASGIMAFDHGSIWQQHHRSYLGRNYFRVENGTGHCDQNPATGTPLQTVAGGPRNGPKKTP